jgi:hypothetical protein
MAVPFCSYMHKSYSFLSFTHKITRIYEFFKSGMEDIYSLAVL